jgi:hypothetical protein
VEQVTFEHVHLNVAGGIATAPKSPAEYDGGYPDPRIWEVLPAYGYYFRHVRGLRMIDCATQVNPTDARAEIVREDVTE